MPWFKVDDTFHGHPKTRKAGLAAMGMWVLAGSYSASYVTEGFIPDWWVAALPQGRKRAAELVDAGLWVRGEQDGEQGWFFHDWANYQPSKAEIEADRAAARERQKAWRAKRRENACHAVSHAVTDGVTDSVSHAVSHASPTRPTRPVPSRKDLTTRDETLHHPSGSVTRDDDPPSGTTGHLRSVNK